MLPGKRTNDGALYVTQGPPPAGTPLVGGIAVSHTGVIYVSQSFVQPFTPADLFKLGEQGAWYDPSDLTTMFQDRAGTTPVTADGQPVGLILDKSKGLVLGPELVTNGTFDTNINGWAPGSTWTSGSAVWNAGKITVTSVTYQGVYQTISGLTIGKTYKLSIGSATGSPFVYIGLNNSPGSGPYWECTGGGVYHFVATATIHTIGLTSAGSSTSTYDTISFKELAGNHAVAPSDAARPLKTSTGAADWINYDAVDDVLNSTFPSSLGSSCTVGRANVGSAATILTAQTIGTSYANSTDNAGLVIVNRALTTQETTDLTAWLTAKGATA